MKKMYLTEYDEAEHLKLLEIEKQREIEAIRADGQREIEEVRAEGQRKLEEVRADGQRKLEEAREETQNEDASTVAIAMRLIREGATTAKELTDQGVPEKIALAFFEEGAFPTERKKNG